MSHDSRYTFSGKTGRLAEELLGLPAMRHWPPPLDEVRAILAGLPYEVIDSLGVGGMGAVYLVRHTTPGYERLEALKLLRPLARDDDNIRQRFLQEIKIMGGLQHPGLVTLHDSGQTGNDHDPRSTCGAEHTGYLWYTMEYVEGRTLAEEVKHRALEPDEVLYYTRQLCAALQCVHNARIAESSGIVHRDVKPENIMLCDGSAMLMDFGIARLQRQSPLTGPGERLYSDGYAAPEQYTESQENPADRRADLYALGKVVQFMAAACHPDDPGGTPTFPPRFYELVDRLIAIDRSDRPASAREVADTLSRLQPGAAGFWGKRESPFRGLEPYEFHHAPIFFGRDAARRSALRFFNNPADVPWVGFCLITGGSGSGKSSLARAGLAPALLRSHTTGSRAPTGLLICDTGDLRAEDDALLMLLARALASGLPDARPAQIASALRHATGSLAELLRLDPARDGVQRCLILDQFEHFFRASLDRASQTRFLAALSRLARTPGVAVIVTLRSDFAHHCAEHPLLRELKDGRHLELSAPQPWEVASMIRLSARAGALTFDTTPGGATLDELLLDHCQHNPQALPLLSYVLDQLWERHDPAVSLLRFSDYELLGGFEGAIATTARQTLGAFAGHDAAGARSTLDALLHLVVETSGSDIAANFVRRRATSEELQSATPEVRHLAETLVTARLLVQDATALTLAHEAILSPAVVDQWPDLKSWLEANAHTLRIRERITLRCRDWLAHARAVELLLPASSLLTEVTDLCRSRPGFFSGEQTEFVRLSELHANAALAAIEAAAKRKALIRRRVIIGLSGLTAVAGMAAAMFWHQRNKALEQEQRAVQARREGDKLVTQVLGPAMRRAGGTGTVADLQRIQRSVTAYFEKLGTDEASPEQLHVLALAWTSAGDTELKRGDLDAAESAYRKALILSERVVATAPDDARLQSELGVNWGNLSKVLRRSSATKDASREACDRYVLLTDTAAKASPENPDLRREQATALYSRGEFSGKLADHKAALAIRRELVAEAPQANPNAAWLHDLGSSLHAIAGLLRRSGNPSAAFTAASESLEIREKLLELEGGNAEWRKEMASSLGLWAMLSPQNQASLEALKRSVSILSAICEVDPANMDCLHELAVSQIILARRHQADSALEDAVLSYLSALKELLPAIEKTPNNGPLLDTTILAAGELADTALKAGKSQTALPDCERVLAVAKATGVEIPPARQKAIKELTGRCAALRELLPK